LAEILETGGGEKKFDFTFLGAWFCLARGLILLHRGNMRQKRRELEKMLR